MGQKIQKFCRHHIWKLPYQLLFSFCSHFTNCQKPWSCTRTGVKLCNELTDIWWMFRRSLEARMGLPRGEQCVNHKYKPLPL